MKSARLHSADARPDETGTVRELTIGQKALWLLYRLDANPAYHLARAMRVKATLVPSLLRQSFQDLVDRHESLRTRFLEMNGEPVACALFDDQVQVTFETAREMERTTLTARLEAEAARPFDLRLEPPFRVTIFETAADEFIALVNVHHIVSDGWSLEILIDEFGRFYEARVNGLTPRLRSRVRQQGDYASWQQIYLSTPAATRARDYWREKLKHVDALDLPYAKSDKRTSRRVARVHAIRFSQSVRDGVFTLAQTQGTSGFVVLLAAFQVLLARMTGAKEVPVCSPMPCRERVEFSGVVGYLANLVVLQAHIAEDRTFLDVLSEVKVTVRNALLNQQVPFAVVARDCGIIGANTGHSPLQVSYAHHRGMRRAESMAAFLADGMIPTVRFGILEADAVLFDERGVQFDLSLSTAEHDESLYAAIKYDAELFDGEVIKLVLDRFEEILAGVTLVPGTTLKDVSVIPPRETEMIAAMLAIAAFPEFMLHAAFAERARRAPENIALVNGTETMSYGELDRRSSAFAASLLENGVTREEVVGVLLPPGFDLIVAILGVLKAGACYVPLDYQFPAERIRFMLEDAGCRFVATAQDASAALIGSARPVYVAATRTEHGPLPLPDGDPTSLAYIIYTSGSTGRPKGAAITHGAVARLFTSTAAPFAFSERDVWTLFHSAAFDFSVWEIFGALLHGGRLVIVPPCIRQDATAFHTLLREQQVTVLNQTPSAFQQLARIDQELPRDSWCVSNVRLVIFGGEALNPRMLMPYLEPANDVACAFVNMYGITETTVHVTRHRVRYEDAQRTGASPIGFPLPDLAVHLLDEWMRPVPLGAAGEICVSGPGLARCYINRPELNVARFVEGGGPNGERIYRSGDLARRQLDGSLYYLGRADDQVKLRGFRIELGEIESVANEFPGVLEAAAAVREFGEGRRICLFYASGKPLSRTALRQHLSSKLPAYMVPTTVVATPTLPRTTTGKVDRRRLPQIGQERQDSEESFVAPSTDEERLLVDVWCDVLGVKEVGIHDMFFGIGGDSILSLSVVSKARSKGLHFDVRDLFEHPTISELARIARRTGTPVQESIAPFSLLSQADLRRLPPGVEDAYPLSALQAGMMFHSELDCGAGVYHELFSFLVRFPLDVAALSSAVEEVVSRYAVLRTSIDTSSFSEAVQLVHRSVNVPIGAFDISDLTNAEQSRALSEFRSQELRHTFDFHQPSLVRFFFHRISQGAFQFSLSFHHVLLDGWSLANLIAEISSRYLTAIGALPSPTIAERANLLPFYIQRERQVTTSAAARAFWVAYLNGAALAALPRTRTASGTPPTARRLSRRLDREHAGALRRIAANLGVPLKSVFLAVHVKVMSFVSSENDVVTGLVSNGRPEVLTGHKAVGIFLNTLPVRMKCDGATWAQLIRDAYEQERKILPFRHFPLAGIQKLRGGLPLFEHNCAYIHMRIYREALGDLVAGAREQLDFYEHTNHSLTTVFEIDPDGDVNLGLRYLDSALAPDDAERILAYYERALGAAASDMHAPSDAATLLSGAELAELLQLSGSSHLTADAYPTITSWIEARASDKPTSKAIVSPDREITYGSLDRLGDKIAAALDKNGIRPGDRVAINAQRRPETLLGIVGILKAGAAFVALDLSEPKDRLHSMFEAAGVRALLSFGEDPSFAGVQSVDGTAVTTTDATERYSRPPRSENGDAVAYVIFTSGSTGRPKGIAIEHRHLVAYVAGIVQRFGLDVPLSFAATGNFGWDHPYTCIMAALCTGGVFCVASEQDILSSARFADFMEHMQVDVLKTSPSLFAALMEGECRADILPKQLLIFGGEPLSAAVIGKVRAINREITIVNHYGPTETTIGATSCQVTVLDGAEAPSIGRPLPNARAYILDPRAKLVPVGSPGELCIGGRSVSQGYVGRPDLTSERFVEVDLPWGKERLYRSGDRAFWDANGEIVLRGRVDDQIKRRGFRIEPAEIDAAALQCSLVREAVTLLKSDGRHAGRLVTYVIGDPSNRGTGLALAALERDRVEEWEQTHEDVYRALRSELEETPIERGLIGWNDSYTGSTFTRAEIDEYLDNYTSFVPAGQVASVLEVGCGAGLVLFHLAPRVRRYVGIDLSHTAVKYISAQASARGLQGVQSLQGEAHCIDEVTSERFDRVIFASVAQKFPSLQYLHRSVLAAIEVAAPNARVVLSDIRDLATLDLFHTSLQLHRAEGSVSVTQLRERIRRAVAAEAELAVAQDYFWALTSVPRVARVVVRPKRGQIPNELTNFRYDVVIELDTPTRVVEGDSVIWDNLQGLTALEHALLRQSGSRHFLRNLQSVRLHRAASALALILTEDDATASVIRRKTSELVEGVDPAALFALADRHGYELAYLPSADAGRGRMNLLLQRLEDFSDARTFGR